MPAPLKHGLARPAVSRLAENIARASPDFDCDGFIAAAMRGISPLELKQRVAHVANALAKFLPEEYSDAIEIIVASSKDWDRGEEGDPLRGFAAWPLFHFIEQSGTGDFSRSMAALRVMTHLFTGEFAIRPFVARSPKRAFKELAKWTRDESEHVRRLVSEGTRSRLPWATRVPALIEDPTPVLALLERLKDDPEIYVRRSVANNLNDIAKDHPELVIDLCESWLKDASPERRWIIERATRTLVKDGHPRVWGLLGFTNDPKVHVSGLELSTNEVSMGDDITFSFDLASRGRADQRLVVDYRVHYVKANGSRRGKVFKLKVLEIEPKACANFSRRVSFRKISTRAYYPGEHAIDVLVNGRVCAHASFELTP